MHTDERSGGREWCGVIMSDNRSCCAARNGGGVFSGAYGDPAPSAGATRALDCACTQPQHRQCPARASTSKPLFKQSPGDTPHSRAATACSQEFPEAGCSVAGSPTVRALTRRTSPLALGRRPAGSNRGSSPTVNSLPPAAATIMARRRRPALCFLLLMAFLAQLAVAADPLRTSSFTPDPVAVAAALAAKAAAADAGRPHSGTFTDPLPLLPPPSTSAWVAMSSGHFRLAEAAANLCRYSLDTWAKQVPRGTLQGSPGCCRLAWLLLRAVAAAGAHPALTHWSLHSTLPSSAVSHAAAQADYGVPGAARHGGRQQRTRWRAPPHAVWHLHQC